jgi:hypothetical protein
MKKHMNQPEMKKTKGGAFSKRGSAGRLEMNAKENVSCPHAMKFGKARSSCDPSDRFLFTDLGL